MKQTKHFLHIPVVLSAFMGLTLMMTTDFDALQGAVSSDGRVLQVENVAVNDVSVTSLKPAANPIAQSSTTAGAQLILGMILLAIGFGLHALLTLKKERSVHVSIIPEKKKVSEPKRKRYLALYWLDR